MTHCVSAEQSGSAFAYAISLYSRYFHDGAESGAVPRRDAGVAAWLGHGEICIMQIVWMSAPAVSVCVTIIGHTYLACLRLNLGL